MTPEPGAPIPLPQRLQDYARFVALVAEQLEALERRDLSRLRELMEEREERERSLRTPDGDEAADPLPFPAELAALLSQGLETLSSNEEYDREARLRWTRLEQEARMAMHGLPVNTRRSGRYVEIGSPDARLDVRF